MPPRPAAVIRRPAQTRPGASALRVSRSAGLTALAAVVTAVLLVALPARGSAQAGAYTVGEWKRVETENFLFVYPEELSEWTLDMASRMEAVRGVVAELVGYAPEDRVTVLVDDPRNVSNGSMNPGPLLYMWPTPPTPRSLIGEHRGWGELLAVHEFAHAAHLTRPSRNPWQRFIESVMPIRITRIMRSTPAWAVEGYATYLEGRLTGSGRPHGLWRPAVLRTWALEGQLPSYGQLSNSSGYFGGAMPYLVGSAYLEWLVEREGGDEQVLPDIWRRLTARQNRSFEGAFAGVFGAPAAELYGHFTVDVTEGALAVESVVEAAGGIVDGELFQRLSWTVGDPTVSPDGERLAVQLTSRDGPSRVVVMSTTPDTLSTQAREAYEEVFERDPEDVEPVQRRPRPQQPKATLYPTLGMAYTAPVWMPDGDGLLVIRNDVESNQRIRPDLFLWHWESGDLRRITRGAAIREAAPAPDGSWAAGVRCLHAHCDIVRIDLATGALTPLTATDPLRPYYHPRVSPDGRTIVASVQRDGAWSLVTMDTDGTNERLLGPDDGASRFDAEFLDDARLVLTSTLGGIHDIEILHAGTEDVRPLTRVVGAAVAPAPAGEHVYFLSLHSRGWDLRRIDPHATTAAPRVTTDAAQSPAAPVPVAAVDTFRTTPPGPVRPYGLGPRFHAYLPTAHLSSDGAGGGIAILGTDPIGRLSWQIQGMLGDGDAPDGASLRMRYRGLRPWVHLEGFWVDHAFDVPVADDPLADNRADHFYGAFGALEVQRHRLATAHLLRAGGSAGRIGGIDADRWLGFGEYRLGAQQGPGHWRLQETVGLHGSLGRTEGSDWHRWIADASVGFRGQKRGIEISGTFARTDAAAESPEGLTVGGAEPLLFDPAVLSQRVPMPALRRGTLRGQELGTGMVEVNGVLPMTAFFWAGNATGDDRGWYRLAGGRFDLDTAPIPYIRLPAVRLRAGLAYLFDDPDAGDWRSWLLVGFEP